MQRLHPRRRRGRLRDQPPGADLHRRHEAVGRRQQAVVPAGVLRPGPPLRGTNTWQLKVLDTAGQPVTGATLTVTPFMPEHGHGSQVVPTITADGDQYKITNLYLFMPGLWKVTVQAMNGATTDSAAFTFCVAG
ncbi:MAG: FixH family protein [Myxococcaceae bacterium]